VIPLLETQKLAARYGDFQALFDIDFEIAAGECVAVIGSNGAGKSTFLSAIAGVLAVKPEAIMFDGGKIGGLATWNVVARGITLVPEGRRLFSSLTVEENLLMGAYGGRPGIWNLNQVYSLFPRLREYRKRTVTTLSGGEQQMVAIGRALMSNPILLMCDELSLGLAPKIIGEIYEVLGRLRNDGITLMIVEQNVEQAMCFANRVYCFRSGRVSLSGSPSTLTTEDVSRAYFGV
jgi:branched-chain amino acid transport system ATP-binding protein